MSARLKSGSKIYFLAICGTGMSALAGLLKDRGYQIAGSDIAAYPPVGDLLKKLQIPVHIGYDVDDLQKFNPDYVVIGNFIRSDNPQAKYVMEKKIAYGSFPSTLEDFFLQDSTNIVVAGTHGKTTTTSCISYILSAAGLKPSFLIGGVPFNFEKSFHVGEGKHFVIEGDEYDTAFFDKESKFLHYRPNFGILTSMEWDHADIFPNVAVMEGMFRKYLGIISDTAIYCRDWDRVHEMVNEIVTKKKISYGFHPTSTHRIENYEESAAGLQFTLDGTTFKNAMSGKFNAENFAASILAARACGLTDATISKALADFKGVKRRQEVRATVGEDLVIDDFAHHPTAVDQVIRGLKAKYPKHAVLIFFEPRSNTSRRNMLQKEWEKAFDQADASFIAPVFKIETLPENERLDVSKISESARSRGKAVMGNVTPEQMIGQALEWSKKRPCVFALLSNGSFDGLHEKLISALKQK